MLKLKRIIDFKLERMSSMKKRSYIVSFFLITILLLSTIGITVEDISKKINLGLDLQGGFEVLYEVEPIEEGEKVDRSLLEATVQTLNDRVNRLGISETVIDIEGENRIRVQLAGVEDQEEARDMLATSAQLSFRDVNDQEQLSGADVKQGSAKQDYNPDTKVPNVTLSLKDAKKFGEVTSEIKDMPPGENLLVIWMDFEEGDSFEAEVIKDEPKFISAPRVSQTLNTSDVEISGNFTVEEAQRLADIINSGSLPVHMEEIFSTSVGAQFGEQALKETVFAGFIAIGLIFLFMIVVYRFVGLLASINLAIYVYLILLIFQLMNGVLTLPGIAALILGVAMAVDANVITFERIKEELIKGKSVKAAFDAGLKNSLTTILDANITTMLAAVVLFIFGTSSIKGFATILIISILVSFLTAVYGTRLFLSLWVKSGYLKNRKSWFGVNTNKIHDINHTEEIEPTFFNKTINVVRHQKKIFILTTSMLVIGAASLLIFQLNPGIDFSSGSRVEILATDSLSQEEIEADLKSLDLEAKSIVLSGDNEEIAVNRFDTVLEKEKINEVKRLFGDKYGKEPSVSVVSPIVGEELVKNALYALGIAAIGMIIYVTLRFEFYFALTSILTIIHDVFFILVVFSIFQIEFDVTIVAALLTLVGYTINNTIVVFDRIRENIRLEKRITSYSRLAEVVNRSVVQSFTRSLNTTLTTLIAVVIFLFFGAESITGFSIALIVGLLAGLYSSLLLASQLWLVLRGRKIKERPLDFRKKKKVEGPQV